MKGRPTQVSKTLRPDTIWLEEWPRLSEKQKARVDQNWNGEKTRLPDARQTRGIFDVSSEDTEYLNVTCEARAKLEKCVVQPEKCSREPDAVPIFKRSGEHEGMNVSKSAGTTSPKRDTCPNSSTVLCVSLSLSMIRWGW